MIRTVLVAWSILRSYYKIIVTSCCIFLPFSKRKEILRVKCEQKRSKTRETRPVGGFLTTWLTMLRGWDYEHNYISGEPSASCHARATPTALASLLPLNYHCPLSLSLSFSLSFSLQKTRYVTSFHCLAA